jgi:superfamily II DNA or RNA helicase
MQGQNDYVNDITSEFDDVWNNENNSNYETLTLSETVGLGVFDTLRTDEGIEQLYKELNSKYETGSDPTEWQLPFKPYDYQVKAAEKWLIEKRGIISFATGTGKTKTAIICMHKFIAKYGPSFFLIIVPDKTLNNQWSDELKELPMNVIQCFSENSDWRGDFSDALEEYRFSKPRSTAIVVTNSTMMKPKFIDMMGRMPENFMLVGDECHHMGTEKMLNCLPNVNYRLGLSATPFVYGNDFLTTQLQTYFGGIIAEYPLSKAILDGRLTRYSYRPIIVGLSDNELTVYRELSHKIAKYEAIRQHQKLSGSEQQQEEMLLFKRARVVYSASEKMHSLKKLLTDPNLVDRLLIYCGVTSASEMSETVSSDDVGMNQLEQVNKMLSEKKIAYAQYTRNEDGQERHNRISDFKQGNIRVMTAIRCLDEGVDIPEITSAIILASSGNPREFIQRRGRLLRLYPGKKLVNIYDMVVLGDDIDSLNKSELTRVREFTEAAENSAELNERFGELFMKYLEEDND